jgi:hypothetical protein
LILPNDSKIKSATNIDIIIDTPDSSTFNWRFGADGDLTLPAGGDILDSTGTSVLGGSVSSLVNGVHTASLGSTGILTLSNGAIATPVDNNVTINTSATVTTNNSFTNTEDFSTDVDLGDGIGVIAGWYQRNSEQIEFALFGPSSFQTYLTGLALGRTVIVTYSTSGGNQTLTRTLTQAFTATGQFDPANPTWGRVSGRIDATLPAGQTGIVRINFPVYSTSSKTLTFGADGSLTLPATGSLSTGSIYFNGSLQTGSQSQYQFEEIVDEGGPSPVYYSKLSLPNIAEIFAGDELSLSTWGSELAVRVRNPSDFSDHTWSFGNNGSLTLPGALTFPSGGGNIRSEGDINIDINLADSTKRIWRFGEDGNLETPGGIQVAGILKIDDGVHEQFQLKADATGTVTHDCSSGHIFYHTSPDANWTANFTNLNLDSTYATSVTLIIVQGATGYYPSAVQIGGAAQTINWQGNVNPTVSTSRTDVVTFSIINNSGTYTVLGQLTGF